MTACNSSTTTNIPAIPVEKVTEWGGVVRISLPIRVYHSHFQISYYDEHGGTKWDTKAVELFPADVSSAMVLTIKLLASFWRAHPIWVAC